MFFKMDDTHSSIARTECGKKTTFFAQFYCFGTNVYLDAPNEFKSIVLRPKCHFLCARRTHGNGKIESAHCTFQFE